PCDSNGVKIPYLINSTQNHLIESGLVANFSFSQKPKGGYNDYYEKMTTYIRMLESHVHVIDNSITSKTFPVIRSESDASIFRYYDTASSRASTISLNEKLNKDKIAIIGLGGTGAYIFDLIAKINVKEIHLFDGDTFLQHNAFRCPGAPSVEDLEKKLTKVEHFSEIYSQMRRGIIIHPYYLDQSNAVELASMNFVFICIDDGTAKKIIIDYLVGNDISFIDVGIGLELNDNSLSGIVRVTTVTTSYNEHISDRISFTPPEENVYSNNIQIADINSLNATLAVIKWKQICGYYADLPQSHHIVYSIFTNKIVNEEALNEEEDHQA
ncbi:MAG: ThiF family adenylyltransferase, partial [Candidatus Bathyarchaeota archaeon]|nr:ThiF family adenylyltransferase [Candidatus Bathyarchaeota archaeon]